MDVGLLLLRATVGLTMAAHGLQKLFGWFGGPGLRRLATGFESAGLRPGPLHAALAGVAEAGGGVALATGFLTPLASTAITAVMVTAIGTTHAPKGFFLSGGGYEYNLVLIAGASAPAFTGPGALSLDHALGISRGGGKWGVAALLAGIAAGGVVLLTRRAAEPAVAGAGQQS
jgi:putative oxidoreductase